MTHTKKPASRKNTNQQPPVQNAVKKKKLNKHQHPVFHFGLFLQDASYTAASVTGPF